MTQAGKKFKDIYDSGATMLTDLEQQATEQMKQAQEEHSQHNRKSAEQSIQQLERKSGLLQTELKQSIDESLKKLTDTLVIENSYSEALASSLLAELKTLAEQMKVRVNSLKQLHQENVDFARSVAAEQYLGTSDEMSFELEQTMSQTIDKLGVQGKIGIDSLRQDLEKIILQVHDNVNEITSSNLVSTEEQADTIADQSSSLLQTLTSDCQNRLKVLESAARQANQEVESSARSLLEEIAECAVVFEKEINQNYEQISAAHFQKADYRLSNCADELSAMHDATTERLISLTDELSQNLLSNSTQVQHGLRNRCDDTVSRLGKSFNAFQNRVNERLQYSQGQKQALESDKHKLLSAVQNELLSIHSSFAKKIATMLEQSKSELADATRAVEEHMDDAIESFSQQMGTSAQSINKQVEEEVAKFLQELSTDRAAALEEISAAAQGRMPTLRTAQTSEDDFHSIPENFRTRTDTPSPSNIQSTDNTQSLTEALAQAETQSPDIAQSQVNIARIEESNLAEPKPRRNRRRKDNKA